MSIRFIVSLTRNICQGGIRVNLTPKMRQSLLNVTQRSQVMPNFTIPLHKYDSKKSLNRQQVLLRLAPTLVKVNDLTPLRQEFSNSAPKIFDVEYTDSTLEYLNRTDCLVLDKLSALFMKCVHTIFNYMGCSTFSRRAVQRCFLLINL